MLAMIKAIVAAHRRARRIRRIKRFVGRLIGALVAIYAGLFCVFYFDLDGKLLYYVVEPFMKNHFDNMERRDPHTVPYMQVPEGEEYIYTNK